ncbi:MAG: ABC transporter permease [Candidatus Norongarragalinales archaeon]
MFLELDKIYAVWLREVKRFWNSKPRVFGSIGQPLFFLLALGFGIGSLVPGMNYVHFIIPGIIAMSLLFSSIFAGVSVIWDREFGFLKEMLVAPLSRTSIVFGRVLGGATTACFQGLIILVIGIFLGLPQSIFLSVVFMALISAGFVAIGIAIASLLNDVEGFQLVVNFVVFPLFFLSNALFPVDKLPAWFGEIASLNPLSWGVGAMREMLVDGSYAGLPLALALLAAFDAVAILAAGKLFDKTSI